MKRNRRLRQSTAPAEATVEAMPIESRIVQHPDGFYWLTELHEVGPFASLDDARADMEAAETEESGVEPGETLEQAEDDIGVETWIDPDTGALAEEQRPRIEDH